MSLDRALGILGFILGLPGFFALFFSPFQTSAAIASVSSVLLLASAVWTNHLLTRHPFRMRRVDVTLAFDADVRRAVLSKDYRLVANFNQLNQIVHKNNAADGSIVDFKWNGKPVPATHQRKVLGEFELTIPLSPAPARGQEFPGRLEYTLLDSFPSDDESLSYVVDFPTRVVSIQVQLPQKKPCVTAAARLSFGGQERELDGLVISQDKRTLTLEVSRPRIGGQLVIYWTW